MSALGLIAYVVMAQTSPMVVTGADLPCGNGYEALAAGDERAALAQMARCSNSESRDAAVQINQAVALARMGDIDTARARFTAAARNADRIELETAQGEWIDSRVLARRGIAMLESGEFAATSALAVR